MSRAEHWKTVYDSKPENSVSWYQSYPQSSLRALDEHGARPSAALIDVGGGASRLVDHLLDAGWRDLTVLDIAAPALATTKRRLGVRANAVSWLVADVTKWQPDRVYDVWHDRAVFHFLTDEARRQGYRDALAKGLASQGLLVMATFAPDGPERCSGLPVQRYDAETLSQELGPEYDLLDHWREVHATPSGAAQAFVWSVFRRR